MKRTAKSRQAKERKVRVGAVQVSVNDGPLRDVPVTVGPASALGKHKAGAGGLALVGRLSTHPLLDCLGLDAEAAAHTIERCRAEFERSGNPLYAWRAYQQARVAGVDLADWVLRYLDTTSAALWTLAADPPRKPAEAIVRAAGFRPRRGSNILDVALEGIKARLAAEVEFERRTAPQQHRSDPLVLHESPVASREGAIAAVAERYGLSFATVERYCRRR